MNEAALTLYTYWRSSAAYRVRIGLNLKGLPWQARPLHLVHGGGQQHDTDYTALNPQALVPTLIHGQRVLTQSLAILEYLDDAFPDTAALLPADAPGRARVRALSQLVACDIHPLNNLRVMQYLGGRLGVDEPARQEWTGHWMHAGFAAMEVMLASSSATGRFCHGDTPGLADCCLLPQLYNARRFSIDLTAYPTLQRIEQHCCALAAFQDAHPDRQSDAA